MSGPFEGVGRLLIDGNNLLHRVSGSVDPGAVRLLLARLRGALPSDVRATVMLDGHPAAGTDRRQRVTRALDIQHAGSLSADDALLNIIRDEPFASRAAITLVSDDRSLIERARRLGARTQRLAWLEALLAGGASRTPGSGIGSGPKRPAGAAPPGEDGEREPWTPGRGATRKRGNPRRGRATR